MKHYGQFLYDAGRGVKMKSSDIEGLYGRKNELERLHKILLKEIEIAENEFTEYICTDWNADEIKEAMNEADIKNGIKSSDVKRYTTADLKCGTIFRNNRSGKETTIKKITEGRVIQWLNAVETNFEGRSSSVHWEGIKSFNRNLENGTYTVLEL